MSRKLRDTRSKIKRRRRQAHFSYALAGYFYRVYTGFYDPCIVNHWFPTEYPGWREGGGKEREGGGVPLPRRNERAVNLIVPLNAVVTYASSKLLTNSRLKFVARERKCAQQLRREAIVHSFGLRMNLLPQPVTETEGNSYILIMLYYFHFAHAIRKIFVIIWDLKSFERTVNICY